MDRFVREPSSRAAAWIRQRSACRWMLVLMVFAYAMPLNAIADEAERSHGASPSSASASVCQRFVDVQWISSERSIGLADYQLINRVGNRSRVTALVDLGADRPKIDYSQMLTTDGQNDEVIAAGSAHGREIIRTWALSRGLRGDAIGFSGKQRSVRVERSSWEHAASLADKRRVVCVRYPDRRRAWIAELPSAQARYGDSLRQRHADATRHIAPADPMWPSLKQFAEAGVIDVNRDGLDDYPTLGVISWGGSYFLLRRSPDRQQDLDALSRLVLDGNGCSCKLDPPDALYLIADGQGILLNRSCNLSDLTGPSDGR